MAKWFLLAALVARSLFDTMEFIGVCKVWFSVVFCGFPNGEKRLVDVQVSGVSAMMVGYT